MAVVFSMMIVVVFFVNDVVITERLESVDVKDAVVVIAAVVMVDIIVVVLVMVLMSIFVVVKI